MKYRIALGADHRGFYLKESLKKYNQLGAHPIEWIDVGTYSDERTDYPLYALKTVLTLQGKEAEFGVLLCGSGIGVAIAANRFKGIYAGVAWNEKVARSAKEDDNVNILCFPADYLSLEEVVNMVQAWLTAEFKGGRYQERLDMVDSFLTVEAP